MTTRNWYREFVLDAAMFTVAAICVVASWLLPEKEGTP